MPSFSQEPAANAYSLHFQLPFSMQPAAMKMPGRAPNSNLHLDYVRDTLFGPVAQTVECQCQMAALTLQGRPALRLHICPPLPHKVERAHSVAFIWDGRSYHGLVRHHGKCGDGGLNLLLELQ